MATVAQVAKASLQAILVQASEAPLEADEVEHTIRPDYVLSYCVGEVIKIESILKIS